MSSVQPSSSIILCFIFRPVIHVELIFCEQCIGCVLIQHFLLSLLFCFCMRMSICSDTIGFQDFPLLRCPCSKMSQVGLSKMSWLLMHIYFWALSSILLIYLSFLLPIPQCLDHHSFTGNLDLWIVLVLQLCSSSKIVLILTCCVLTGLGQKNEMIKYLLFCNGFYNLPYFFLRFTMMQCVVLLHSNRLRIY